MTFRRLDEKSHVCLHAGAVHWPFTEGISQPPRRSSPEALILRIEQSGYPPKQYRYRKYIEVKLAYTKASLPMLASLYVASKCTEGGCCTMVNPRTIVSSIPLIAMAGSSAM